MSNLITALTRAGGFRQQIAGAYLFEQVLNDDGTSALNKDGSLKFDVTRRGQNFDQKITVNYLTIKLHKLRTWYQEKDDARLSSINFGHSWYVKLPGPLPIGGYLDRNDQLSFVGRKQVTLTRNSPSTQVERIMRTLELEEKIITYVMEKLKTEGLSLIGELEKIENAP